MERLSGLESLYLQLDGEHTPMHVSSLTIYNPNTAQGGKVEFADVQRFFSERMHRNGMFRRRVAALPFPLGRPYWVDEADFDIEYHLRQIALPRPGDWKQLCTQVARLHARPLDRSRPLWECTMIEELDNIPGLPPGCFALLIKTHCAALGGELGTQLLSSLHELSPHSNASRPKEASFFDHHPTMFDLALRNVVDAAKWPFELWRYVFTHMAPVIKFGAIKGRRLLPWPRQEGITTQSDTVAPPTRLNRRISKHRVVAGELFDLTDMEAMCGKVTGANLNDVALAVIGGALRRFFNDHLELPGTSLLVDAPVSMRAPVPHLARRGIANSAVLPLFTDASNPAERLRLIVQATHRHRASFRSYVGKRLALDALEFVPTMLLGLIGNVAQHVVSAKNANTSVNRVLGPASPLYFSGAQLVRLYSLAALHDRAGIAHTVSHYNGQLSIGAVACRSALPDMERYAACLRTAYEELRRALGLAETVARSEPAATNARPLRTARRGGAAK